MKTQVLLAGVLSALGSVANGQLFQPDSAVASSEFSGSYDIGNAIDGSGFPAVFSFMTPHSTYTTNNHWTTRSNPVNPNATFFFNEEKTIRQFFLWNHRSNGVASDPNYAVKRFTLTFFDAADQVLAVVEDLPAEQNVSYAQLYAFDVVEGVRSVRINILENYGSQYRGFAEVAFSPTVLACSGADTAAPVGVLNFLDVSAFLSAYNSGSLSADLAEPVGTFNFFDVSAYLDLYNAGCL